MWCSHTEEEDPSGFMQNQSRFGHINDLLFAYQNRNVAIFKVPHGQGYPNVLRQAQKRSEEELRILQARFYFRLVWIGSIVYKREAIGKTSWCKEAIVGSQS